MMDFTLKGTGRLLKRRHTRMMSLICLVSAALCLNDSAAQDPIFSQFYSAPLQINPGLAGIAYAPNFAMNYRNQWPSINKAYQTYAVSYDQFFRQVNSGVGLMVLADNAGDGILKTTKVSGAYAYRVEINRNWEARWGLEAAWVQTRLDWDKLVFFDQIDEELGPVSPGGIPFPSAETPPDNLNQSYFDIGTGGVLYNEKFYIGVSLKHLNTPDLSYLDVNSQLRGGIPIRWIVHTGGEFPLQIGNKRRFRPFIAPGLLFVKQGGSMQLNAGTFVGLENFYGGVWYRHANRNPDAVIIAAGFRSGIIRVTYSYDVTISKLSINSGGSHELGLIITLEDKNREPVYNDCFSIFR